jgi:hypothetical protein
MGWKTTLGRLGLIRVKCGRAASGRRLAATYDGSTKKRKPMKTSLHLKIAAIVTHVALCTAIVLEAVQSEPGARAPGGGAVVPVYHPDHR